MDTHNTGNLWSPTMPAGGDLEILSQTTILRRIHYIVEGMVEDGDIQLTKVLDRMFQAFLT